MKIRDLAKHLKVSPATVSRALNPALASLVAEPLRERIQTYAAKVHYRPNAVARNLARGRSQTLGVILYYVFNSPFFDDYLVNVQRGLYTVLSQFPSYGCKMMLLPNGKTLSDLDDQVIGSGVDGLLISTVSDHTGPHLQGMAYAAQKRWERPMVALNLSPKSSSAISTVSFSNKEGASLAALHLLRRGHRKIGVIALADGSPDLEQRSEGFRETLADHHCPLIAPYQVHGDSTVIGGYRATIELFKRPQTTSLTALFCMNDEMALGALRALKALGKRCPQDVALMGFDGLPTGEFTTPSLSTVRQPTFELAQAGTRLLIDQIEGRLKAPQHQVLPSQLLLRESA